MEDLPKPKAKFSDPQFYDKLGMNYHEIYSNDPGLISSVKKFISKLPTNASVIECGPGTGIVAKTLVDGGCRLLGIDMSQGMVAICRKRVPGGTFEVANMLKYEAPESSYDGAVASLSIFEISKEELIIMTKKWGRWVKPGGFLFIATCDPAEWGTPAEAFDADGCATEQEAKFVDTSVLTTLFNREGWKKLLARGGFEVVEIVFDRFQPNIKDFPIEPRLYYIARKTGSVEG